MVSVNVFTKGAGAAVEGGAKYGSKVGKVTLKTSLKEGASKLYRGFQKLAPEALPKALKSPAAKKVYAVALAAGIVVTADAVANTIEKNNTPLDIVSITNAPNSTNWRIKFLNPKPIEIDASDSFKITLSNSDPVVDGEYKLSKVISQTEVEIASTVELKTAGTKGTINVHTTFWKEFADTCEDTVDSVGNLADDVLDASSKIMEAPSKIMEALKMIGWVTLVCVIAAILFFFARWISKSKPHHRMTQYGRNAYNYMYSMRPWGPR